MVDHINNGEEGFSVREKLNTVIDRTNTLNGIENQVESNKNLSQQNKARIDGLEVEVDGKSDKGHKHSISDVNGLNDALDGKQPVGDYVTEAPDDGYQYGRQLQGGVMTWTVNEGGSGGAGAGMIISAEPPPAEEREPGLQWMNENTGEIWIWDGVRWLEFPASGQIGPQGEKGDKGDKGDPGDPGSDANVDLSAYSTTVEADAKYQPKGDYLTDFTELDPTVPSHVKSITTTNISHWNQAWDEATEANGWGNHADAGYGAETWLQNGDDIYYNTGNVGIGTASTNAQLEVRGSNDTATFRGAGNELINVNFDANVAELDFRNAATVNFSMQGVPALTINSAGNATFGSFVEAGGFQILGSAGNFVAQVNGEGSQLTNNINGVVGAGGLYCYRNSQKDAPFLTFTNDGNASTVFRVDGDGTVNTPSLVMHSSEASPINILGDNSADAQIRMQNNVNNLAMHTRINDIGSYEWVDNSYASVVSTITQTGTFSTRRMIQDGSPVIDAKGLISTLSTLRNATKDETTLEGMRDALADAIGGLIENLEHEISTMPAEDQS